GILDVVGADLLEVAVDLHGSLGRGHYIDARAKQLEREPRDEALFFLKAICDQRGNAWLLGHRSFLASLSGMMVHDLVVATQFTWQRSATLPEVMQMIVASPARMWPCQQIVVGERSSRSGVSRCSKRAR